MKKIIMMLLALVMIAPVYADGNNKSQMKERKKELKEKVKRLQKEGWEVLGTHTLKGALTAHYDRLNTLGDDGREVEGIAVAKSKNLGKQAARTNAAITFASECGAQLKGRAYTELFTDGVNPDAEFDKFIQSFEVLVQKEIGDELQPTFTMVRQNPNGTYEVRSYFIVNEKAAYRTQRKALNEALQTTDLLHKYGDKISKFVNDGFKE